MMPENVDRDHRHKGSSSRETHTFSYSRQKVRKGGVIVKVALLSRTDLVHVSVIMLCISLLDKLAEKL